MFWSLFQRQPKLRVARLLEGCRRPPLPKLAGKRSCYRAQYHCLLCCAVPCRVVLCCVVLCLLCCVVFCCVGRPMLLCGVLCCAWCSLVLHNMLCAYVYESAVLHRAVLLCAALCCAVLRCAALCRGVLLCALCAVLCCGWCAVVCCAVLRGRQSDETISSGGMNTCCCKSGRNAEIAPPQRLAKSASQRICHVESPTAVCCAAQFFAVLRSAVLWCAVVWCSCAVLRDQR